MYDNKRLRYILGNFSQTYLVALLAVSIRNKWFCSYYKVLNRVARWYICVYQKSIFLVQFGRSWNGNFRNIRYMAFSILQPIGISVYIILVYSMVIWYMYCSKNNLTTLVLRRIWNFCYKIDQARQSFLGWYNICTGTGIYISNMPDYNKIHHMAVKYTNWSYIYIYIPIPTL
jgi:hypothetical protein